MSESQFALQPACPGCKNLNSCLALVGSGTISKCLWWGYLLRNNVNLANKSTLIDYIDRPAIVDARNRMGCDENWYNPYYAIKNTFPREEIAKMTDQEIRNLIKLADAIAGALY